MGCGSLQTYHSVQWHESHAASSASTESPITVIAWLKLENALYLQEKILRNDLLWRKSQDIKNI